MKWKIQEMLSGHPQFKFSIFAKKKWNSAERVRLLSSCSWWRVCDLISHTPTTLPTNTHLFIAAKRTIWDDLGGSYTWQKQKNMLLNALAEQPEPFGGVSEKLTTYNIATKCTRALVWASIMVLSSAVIKSNPIMLGLHAIFAIYVMKISVSVCGCETLNTSGTQKQRKKASAFGYISGENSKLHCYHGRNLLDNFYYCRLLIAFTKTFTSCEKRCVVPDQATS